jgi:small subunit ribosomal protein S15
MAHGSKNPPFRIVPKWLKYNKEDVEGLILKLAKERYSSAQIGLVLRDQYGIPDVKTITKKTISQILKSNGITYEVPEDMIQLMKKAVKLRDHLRKSKRDNTSKYGLEKLESRIRRLGKYYSRNGKLPKDWKYDVEKAKLIIQK